MRIASLIFIAAIVVLFLGCAAVAFAQDAAPIAVASLPDPGSDPGGWFGRALEAVRGSEWRVFAALLLVGFVWVARRYGGKIVPWFYTGKGGAFLVLVGGVLGAIANALAAGAGWSSFSPGLLLDGLEVGVLSAGGWSAVRHLFGLDSATKA